MRKKQLFNREEVVFLGHSLVTSAKKGVKVDQIIMFGSYAKGEQKPSSDLDLCIVSKDFGKNNFDKTVMLKKATSKIDSMIEPHPYHLKDLQNKWDLLAVEILKHGKVIRAD